MISDTGLMAARRFAVLLLVAWLAITATLEAQSENPAAGRPEISEGFTIQGATGLFSIISPALLRPGNIAAGFTRQQEVPAYGMTSSPVTLGYGLARYTEAFVSFAPVTDPEGTSRSTILLGLKLLGLSLGRAMGGLEGEYQLAERSVTGANRRSGNAIARMLMGFEPGAGLRVIGNGGYRFAGEDESASAAWLFGAGISYPVGVGALIITDGSFTAGTGILPAMQLHVGTRLLALEHVQINVAVQIDRRDARTYPGLLLGAGFSSEILRTTAEDQTEAYFPVVPPLNDVQSTPMDVEKPKNDTENGQPKPQEQK